MIELETKNKDVAILVSSFDGFSDLWSPFFMLFWRYWPDCPYPVYLISNNKIYENPRITTIMVGEDRHWSGNFITALYRVPHSVIIYTGRLPVEKTDGYCTD